MKRWIKLIATIALAVSIPLQGFAAVSMSACNTSKVSMGASMGMNSAHTNTALDKSTVQSAACDKNCCVPTGSNSCFDQKCSTCHLSVFQLPDTRLLAMPDLATVYQDLISESYQTFPPALFRPPKLLSA